MKVKLFGVAFFACLSLSLSAAKMQNVNVAYFDETKVAELSQKLCVGADAEREICDLRIEYHLSIAANSALAAIIDGIASHSPHQIDGLVGSIEEGLKKSHLPMNLAIVMGISLGIHSLAVQLIESKDEESYGKLVSEVTQAYKDQLSVTQELINEIIEKAKSLSGGTLTNEFYIDPMA